MGLVTVNVIIAMTLSATVLKPRIDNTIVILTDNNIAQFIEDFARVTSGLDARTKHHIAEYLVSHLDENGTFRTELNYKTPDGRRNESEMEMNRMEFISHVLKGLDSMARHETETRIEYVKLQEDKKSAQVIVTNYERGILPYDDNMGNIAQIPVLGTSHCEQTLSLSKDGKIKINDANCMSYINFEDAY
jgi:hypothetical protein